MTKTTDTHRDDVCKLSGLSAAIQSHLPTDIIEAIDAADGDIVCTLVEDHVVIEDCGDFQVWRNGECEGC